MRSYAGPLTLAVSIVCVVAAPADAAVTISSKATQNMSCSAGVCAPTADGAILNAGDLENLLASGDVTVTTTGSGGVQADKIGVRETVGWLGGSTLSLDATESILIDKPVSVEGQGGLSLNAVTLSFTKKGRIRFKNLSSALTINGAAFTLESSIASLANAIASNPGGNYALANDYDASQDGTYSDSPVAKFPGNLEGLGNSISNLSIDAPYARHLGLFGRILSTGQIEDLHLIHANVTGGYRAVGGLAGSNQGAITDSSADIQVQVNGEFNSVAGGLFGLGAAGGLVGFNGGVIRRCSSSGSMEGGILGGLVGRAEKGSVIDQSYATSAVTGIGGGLVGDAGFATITNSYATGAVGTTGATAGGLVGKAAISGGQIAYSYSIGAVSGYMVGGFVGYLRVGAPVYSYWDTTTSGTDQGTGNEGNVSGLTGLTTQQLQSGLPAGFDPSIWNEKSTINNGLPYLIANPPPE